MTMRLALLPALFLVAFACVGAEEVTEDVASTEAALELEFGGFDDLDDPALAAEIESTDWQIDEAMPELDVQLASLEEVDRPDICGQGVVLGRYVALGRGIGVARGRILGRDRDGDGLPDLWGRMKAIWGTRRDGSHVFFGKAVSVEGNARGRFRGVAEDGQFHAHWIKRNGVHGVMFGRYGNLPNRRGGAFVGRWARTDCDDVEPEPEPE